MARRKVARPVKRTLPPLALSRLSCRVSLCLPVIALSPLLLQPAASSSKGFFYYKTGPVHSPDPLLIASSGRFIQSPPSSSVSIPPSFLVLLGVPPSNAPKMAAFPLHHHYPLAVVEPSSSYLLSPSGFDLPHPPPPRAAGHLAPAAVPSWLPGYFPAGPPAVAAVTSAAAAAHLAAPSAPAPAAESCSSLTSGSGGGTGPSGGHKVASASSSSSAHPSEVASREPRPMARKRKEGQQQSSASALPDDAKEAGRWKQKKRSSIAKAEEKKAGPEVPAGYIHVRARRGQATDSHSLAERARREKISERMKMLQGLVPGCDKVVGKALMLDEIINYVQSLQHQVEFLSMKLASMNPMLYDSSCFDLEFINGFAPEADGICGIKLQKPESTSPAPQPVQQACHIQPASVAETTNACSVQDAPVSFLLHGQGPSTFPQGNNSSFVMQLVGDTRQWVLNQENVCAFQ